MDSNSRELWSNLLNFTCSKYIDQKWVKNPMKTLQIREWNVFVDIQSGGRSKKHGV